MYPPVHAPVSLSCAESAEQIAPPKETVVDCGWGRLIFGQTFDDPARLSAEIQNEAEERRDVAIYVQEPHVVLAHAPQALFLDPSHTFRLPLDGFEEPEAATGSLAIRPAHAQDESRINAIYRGRSMVPVAGGFCARAAGLEGAVLILVACDPATDEPVGVVMGVDHGACFADPESGSSLWALAVDTQARAPGVGRALVIALARHFKSTGRAFMDLSVMYDNQDAIALYRQLGFDQVPVYCVKKKNQINERLFIGPELDSDLNIYAQIIVDEARRRGIAVEVEDAEAGLFKLSLGGRTISCRESLSDLTSAVALSRCDDKSLTHRLLRKAGLNVPAQVMVETVDETVAFYRRHGRIVVKPARGEQGKGVHVDPRHEAAVREAFHAARALSSAVVAEEFVAGRDLRIIVIDGQTVAAAVREPATILGDGLHTIAELIEKQSRRRAAATRGESSIPLDGETQRCVRDAGYGMDEILSEGRLLAVRKTANLHTGGTISDVTPDLHPKLAEAAVRAAAALEMPVVGLDFIVPAVDQETYHIIEANERPGLANHEPAPTAQRFIDCLFPQTRSDGLRRA
jgi:GNAT-family acetyltransferase (TIGR03103 family)